MTGFLLYFLIGFMAGTWVYAVDSGDGATLGNNPLSDFGLLLVCGLLAPLAICFAVYVTGCIFIAGIHR